MIESEWVVIFKKTIQYSNYKHLKREKILLFEEIDWSSLIEFKNLQIFNYANKYSYTE